MVSAILSLFTFWIEELNLAVGICLAAMMLECFTGYSLMKMLPPSTSQAPNIGTLNLLKTNKYWELYENAL